MFRFSSLLCRTEEDASPARPLQVRPEPAAAPAWSVALDGSADTSSCVSDRVRRDLDEQMQRLAELLDRVESLDFDEQAAAGDVLTIHSAPARESAIELDHAAEEHFPAAQHDDPAVPFAEPPPGPTFSVLSADGPDQAADTPAPHLVACEIVLASGVFTRPAELAEQELGQPDTLQQPGQSGLPPKCAAKEPSGSSTEISRTGFLMDPAGSSGSTSDPNSAESASVKTGTQRPGIACDYADSGDRHSIGAKQDGGPAAPAAAQQPARRARRASRPGPVDGLVRPNAAAAVAVPQHAESQMLNVLAVCGGLLTLAALLYVAADLLSWF